MIVINRNNCNRTSQSIDGVPVSLKGDLAHWPLVAQGVNATSLDVKSFIQFNRLAFVITTDDRVYAYGTSEHSMLGIGKTKFAGTPAEIVELRSKGIIKLCSGIEHVVALSSSGEVWMWGENKSSQLGSIPSNNFKPIKANINNIVDIACSWRDSFGLTKAGTVIAWGNNQHGQLGLGNTNTNHEMVTVLGLSKVVSIAASSYFEVTMALNSDGTLYAWGEDISRSPKKVDDKKIIKIAAAANSRFALAEDKRIYQVTTRAQLQLFTSSANIPLFDEIYTDHSLADNYDTKDVLVAVAVDGRIFVWKNVRESNTFEVLTNTDVGNVFAQVLHSGLSMSYMINNNLAKPNTDASHEQLLIDGMFNNTQASDIHFIVEGRPIYVLRYILSTSSDHMKGQLSSTWRTSTSVTINDFTHQTFADYLRYLYTYQLKHLTVATALNLHDLAHQYHETRLAEQIAKMLNAHN